MKVVISGVNLVEAGPLKVFKDVITAFAERDDFNVVCLVHNRSLFPELLDSNVELIEYPSIKKSWFKRCWFEYVSCLNISRQLSPDVWLSMHDISPNVSAPLQFVYCHNPSPFYKASRNEVKYEFKLYLFSLFYKWLYRINIKANKAVIVQQEWIGKYLVEHLGAKDYIVSKPVASLPKEQLIKEQFSGQSSVTFFFPALARTFKNFELILNALRHLKKHHESTYQKIEVILTIDDSSGKYASSLINKYKELERVKYLGTIAYDEVVALYNSCDVVLFPSKLETWGLPISEAKEFSKPIILADLPYAHETLGSYSSALFVDPDDYIHLANKIKDMIDGQCVFGAVNHLDSSAVVGSWSQLVDKIKSMTLSAVNKAAD